MNTILTKKLIAAVEILRPINCIMGSLTVLIGILFSSPLSSLREQNSLHQIGIPIFIYILIAGASNAINDYFDIEIDKINRPKRPLPSNRLTMHDVKRIFYMLNLVALALTILYFSFHPSAWYLIIIVICFEYVGYFYAKTGKKLGFLGNIMVGVSFSFGVVFGALCAVEFEQITINILWIFLTSFGLLVARELVKGMEDLEGDRQFGIKTIANLFGDEYASRIAQIFILISIVALIQFIFTSDHTLSFGIFFLFSGTIVSIACFILLFMYKSMKPKTISIMLKGSGFLGILGFFSLSLIL